MDKSKRSYDKERRESKIPLPSQGSHAGARSKGSGANGGPAVSKEAQMAASSTRSGTEWLLNGDQAGVSLASPAGSPGGPTEAQSSLEVLSRMQSGGLYSYQEQGDFVPHKRSGEVVLGRLNSAPVAGAIERDGKPGANLSERSSVDSLPALEEARENIMVVLRLRPLNERETAAGEQVAWEVMGRNSLRALYTPRPGRGGTGSGPSSGGIWQFDRVFGPSATSQDVYKAGGAHYLVESALKGINATVFAYGMTGSGKTFTMKAVMHMALQDIFEHVKSSSREIVVRFSAVEIYNEVVRDLLDPSTGSLRLLDDPVRGTVVERLSEEAVESVDHAVELLERCDAERSVGETALNDMSSRSHQIVRLTVESSARAVASTSSSTSSCSTSENSSWEGSSQDTALDAQILSATLNFVDLAGSERLAQTAAEGARLKEGAHINRSLLTLGTVIRKLSGMQAALPAASSNSLPASIGASAVDGAGGELGPQQVPGQHIPYRDSKLTRILQQSLGGNGRTLILGCVSPALPHADHTRNTLAFAAAAKLVRTSAHVNVVVSDKAMVVKLQRDLARMQAEMAKMQGQLLAMEVQLLTARHAEAEATAQAALFRRWGWRLPEGQDGMEGELVGPRDGEPPEPWASVFVQEEHDSREEGREGQQAGCIAVLLPQEGDGRADAGSVGLAGLKPNELEDCQSEVQTGSSPAKDQELHVLKERLRLQDQQRQGLQQELERKVVELEESKRILGLEKEQQQLQHAEAALKVLMEQQVGREQALGQREARLHALEELLKVKELQQLEKERALDLREREHQKRQDSLDIKEQQQDEHMKALELREQQGAIIAQQHLRQEQEQMLVATAQRHEDQDNAAQAEELRRPQEYEQVLRVNEGQQQRLEQDLEGKREQHQDEEKRLRMRTQQQDEQDERQRQRDHEQQQWEQELRLKQKQQEQHEQELQLKEQQLQEYEQDLQLKEQQLVSLLGETRRLVQQREQVEPQQQEHQEAKHEAVGGLAKGPEHARQQELSKALREEQDCEREQLQQQVSTLCAEVNKLQEEKAELEERMVVEVRRKCSQVEAQLGAEAHKEQVKNIGHETASTTSEANRQAEEELSLEVSRLRELSGHQVREQGPGAAGPDALCSAAAYAMVLQQEHSAEGQTYGGSADAVDLKQEIMRRLSEKTDEHWKASTSSGSTSSRHGALGNERWSAGGEGLLKRDSEEASKVAAVARSMAIPGAETLRMLEDRLVLMQQSIQGMDLSLYLSSSAATSASAASLGSSLSSLASPLSSPTAASAAAAATAQQHPQGMEPALSPRDTERTSRAALQSVSEDIELAEGAGTEASGTEHEERQHGAAPAAAGGRVSIQEVGGNSTGGQEVAVGMWGQRIAGGIEGKEGNSSNAKDKVGPTPLKGKGASPLPGGGGKRQSLSKVDARRMLQLFKRGAEENLESVKTYVAELREQVLKLHFQKQLLLCQVLELESQNKDLTASVGNSGPQTPLEGQVSLPDGDPKDGAGGQERGRVESGAGNHSVDKSHESLVRDAGAETFDQTVVKGEEGANLGLQVEKNEEGEDDEYEGDGVSTFAGDTASHAGDAEVLLSVAPPPLREAASAEEACMQGELDRVVCSLGALWHETETSLVQRTEMVLFLRALPTKEALAAAQAEEQRLQWLSAHRHRYRGPRSVAIRREQVCAERDKLLRVLKKSVLREGERNALYTAWGVPLRSRQRKWHLVARLWDPSWASSLPMLQRRGFQGKEELGHATMSTVGFLDASAQLTASLLDIPFPSGMP